MGSEKKRTILIVDDEAMIALSQKATLIDHGYDAITVNSGEKAIEKVQVGSGIDLILMDIDLGEGMDGTETAARILANHDVPIVFCSNHTEPGIVEKTEKITSYGYVVKGSNGTVLDASIKMAFKLFDAYTEKRISEEAARKSEANLRLIAENVNDLISRHAMDGTCTYLSASCRGILGYSPAELVGVNPYTLVHPDDVRAIRDIHGAAAANMSAELISYRIRRKDGTYRWLESSSKVLIDPASKEPFEIVCISRDITERRDSERLLHDSEEKFRSMVKNSTDAVVLVNAAGEQFYISDASVRDTGYSIEELKGPISSVIYPDDLGIVMQAWSDVLDKKNETVRVQYRHKHKYRDYIWYEAIAQNFLDNPAINAVIVNVRDITENKELERELRLAQATMEAASDALYWIAPDNRIVNVNLAACKMLGYDRVELLGMTVQDIDAKFASETGRFLFSGLREKGSLKFDSAYRDKYGRMIPVEIAANYMRFGDEELVCAFVRDDTVRRQAQELIEQKSMDIGFIKNLALKLTETTATGVSIPLQLMSIKEYTKASLAAFSEYDGSKKALVTRHVEADHSLLKDVIKIAGKKILATVSPVSDAVYRQIIHLTVESYDTLTGASFGAIPSALDKAIRKISGLHVFYGIAHVISGKLYGSTLLGYAKDQAPPSQDLLNSYAHLGAISLRRALAEESLHESEMLFNQFMANIPAKVSIKDERLNPVRISRELEVSLGNGSFVPPCAEHADKAKAEELKILKNGIAMELEEELNGRVYSTLKFPLRRPGGQASYLAVFSRDITERKKNEAEIRKLLAEKELILKEVHHRIKNNMATMNSLLSLQANSSKDQFLIAALKDAARRLQSMGLLYDKLYQSAAVTALPMESYLSPLIDEILSNFPEADMVRVDKKIGDFILDAKRLQPIGLIINELLTNILKYAFVKKTNATITVSAVLLEGRVSIMVGDNGVGMPESVSFDKTTGFGLMLVDALAAQLNGTVRIERGGGTRIVLEFGL